MKRTLQKAFFLILLVLAFYSASTQNFHMVKDIDTATDANPFSGGYLNTGVTSSNYTIIM